MLPIQQVMPQNYIYQPIGGISTVSTIHPTFGSQNVINQYPQLMQFMNANASIPMTITDNKQLSNNMINIQSNFQKVMVNQVPIKQEFVNTSNEQLFNQIISTQPNFSNAMTSQVQVKREIVNSDNNNSYDFVNNNIQNNVIINNTTNNINHNNNKLTAIKIVGLKPGENLSMKNIQGLPSGTQGSVLIKTKNGYQLVKLGSLPNNADATFQVTPMDPKVSTTSSKTDVPTTTVSHHLTPGSGILNLNQSTLVSSQTPVISHITSSVSSAIVNTPTPSTMKTFTVPANSVLSTSLAASAQSNEQKGLQKLHNFFKYLMINTADIADDSKKQLQNLIQSFVNKEMRAEDFCAKLVVILKAEHHPKLVNFLNQYIQDFRRALYMGELSLEGIRAPPVNVVSALQPSTATNNQIFIKSIDGRSIPVSVNKSQSLKIVKPLITVPATVSSSTVNVPAVNKTIPSPAGRIVPPTVVTGTTQVRTGHGQASLTPAKAQTQVVNTLDKLKPVTTPVSGKKIVRKINRQLPAMISLKNSQKLSTAVSNVNRLSPPTISNLTGPLLSTTSNASGPPLPIMTYENVKKLPVSSATIQKPLNCNINIGNVQSVNSKRSTISALAKDKKQASPETDVSDLTDIMKLGGVDVDKETENNLGVDGKIGAKIRSCEDKLLLNSSLLQEKINKILKKYELEKCNKDVLALVSHATEQRLKDLVEKMAVIAEHRVDFNKADPRYESTQDVRAQLRFLEEVDKVKREKREAEEREEILKAGKSRSKNEELVKLKEQAKKIEKIEMEQRLTRETNQAALLALGPRKKKPRLEDNAVSTFTPRLIRPRIKRVGTRDLIFILEQEKSSYHSQFLYKAYLKPSKK